MDNGKIFKQCEVGHLLLWRIKGFGRLEVLLMNNKILNDFFCFVVLEF